VQKLMKVGRVGALQTCTTTVIDTFTLMSNRPNAKTAPVVIAIATGTILNPLDATMLAVALPAIHVHFGASMADGSWLVSGFFLASAASQALMGKLADRLGPRAVFRAGMLVIAISCAIAPFCPSLGWLVAARIVQALGTSTAFPAGMSVIREHLRHDDGSLPVKAMGVVTTVNTLSAAIGPLIGGILITSAGWAATFLANIPVALLALILAERWLPEDRIHHVNRQTKVLVGGLDLIGALLYTVPVVALLLALLNFGTTTGWCCLILVVPLAAVFIVWECRTDNGFMDISLLRARPGLLLIFTQYGLANLAYYGLLFALPAWLQITRCESPTIAGSVLFPIASCSAAVTPLAANWIHRRGPLPTLFTASVMLIVGGTAMFTVTPTTPLVLIAVIGLLIGIANNPTTLGLQAVLYSQIPRSQTGTLSGIFQSFRYVGAIMSTALLGNAFNDNSGENGLLATAVVVLGIGITTTIMNGNTRKSFKAPGRDLA
jgi:MFS family permease